tara:strand:+ start:370 stop:471 length:102 start_codon:yes stop_codon:yes gene_type:complete
MEKIEQAIDSRKYRFLIFSGKILLLKFIFMKEQ